MFSIYFLGDPVLHEFRYVGQAKYPEKRFNEHVRISKFSKNYVDRWIKSLLDKGLKPQLFIITEVKTKEEVDILEKYWIKKLRDIGCPLTNITDGGGGMVGFKHSIEAKKKMSEAKKNKPKSIKHRQNMSKAAEGKPKSIKHRQNMSKARKGQHYPKLSEAQKGKRLGVDNPNYKHGKYC